MTLRIIINIVVIYGLFWRSCYAADVFYVDNSPKRSVFEEKLELVCRFYGLEVKRLLVGDGKRNLQILDTVSRSDGLAMVITATALQKINGQKVLGTLGKKGGGSMPLLVMDVTPTTDPNLLNRWSGSALIGCTESDEVPLRGFYKVADLRDITRQLAGQFIPFSRREYHLVLDNNRESLAILTITNATKETLFPIFVETNVDGRGVFFLAGTQPSDSSGESTWEYTSKRFFEIAPIMIFLRNACGERCWHSPGNYANLTIDDPWLTEPYGHLCYKGLLEEMEKHNFHTTIAFIPWNFDRSEPEVASLFHEHPDRFSLCVHGNNHDHYEFFKYETKLGDTWPAKPLNVQENNIKQAIARMEEFRRLTALSYHRVMVFPHSIAPAKTIGLLKKYNFLATVNARNIPLGAKEPNDLLYHLRLATLEFESFPSLNRYPPSTTQSDIAINLFLDNPVLFHTHHDFFENGIDEFNKIAEMVNNIQPDIQWRSLGYITKRLYLQRLRDDGNYDVLAFSSNVVLENRHQKDLTYVIRKEESFSIPIKQVTVNGQLQPYDRSGNYLILRIPIPAKECRHIIIEYENDLDLASIDVSKDDERVNLLRKLSDFRDMTLSRNVLGRTFVQVYYGTGVHKFGLKRSAILLIVMAFFMASACWYLRQRYKKRRP